MTPTTRLPCRAPEIPPRADGVHECTTCGCRLPAAAIIAFGDRLRDVRRRQYKVDREAANVAFSNPRAHDRSEFKEMTFPMIPGGDWFVEREDGRIVRVVAFSLNFDGDRLVVYSTSDSERRDRRLVHANDRGDN